MEKGKDFEMSDKEKYLEQRKRKKINIRHYSLAGKGKNKGMKAWLRSRRRVRRHILSR